MNLKEAMNIDESFFEIDRSNNTAAIILEFERPEDVFDTNYASKVPVLSDDFLELISGAFDLVSPAYKIDLTVRFDDMGDHSEKELSEIFGKNINLELKRKLTDNGKRNRIAYSLMGVGVLFFMFMLMINHLWNSESIWKEIFSYISDIATTVTFWEAMTILVVEQKENRAYMKNLRTRFSAIRFVQKKVD